jgi:hypothetical protein
VPTFVDGEGVDDVTQPCLLSIARMRLWPIVSKASMSMARQAS